MSLRYDVVVVGGGIHGVGAAQAAAAAAGHTVLLLEQTALAHGFVQPFEQTDTRWPPDTWSRPASVWCGKVCTNCSLMLRLAPDWCGCDAS
jgi:choline dehydrogenase-like flavoprotein